MTVIDSFAEQLHIKPEELINKSLRIYLEQNLRKIESELYIRLKKYGIIDVFDLDKKLDEGDITENLTYEDYFAIDNLESEREKIIKLLKDL
jgi:hypothetical protein